MGKLSKFSRKRPVSTIEGEGNRSTDSLGKFGNYLSKIQQRPQSVFVKGAVKNDADSTSSSVASLAPPSSKTRRSTAPSDHSHNTASDDFPSPQSRDPLWSAFKSLEAEYQKFQSRTGPMRMGLIRSVLIPFMRNYASHPSNKQVHHEDLERRATIMNKWWGGLLEMLDGKSSQTVAGVDRPILLEAITIVMMRPEWRQSTTLFSPLSDRNPRVLLKKKSRTGTGGSLSDESLSSTDSDYIAESAEHNVRTMFISNLMTQMTIVVEKLSQRHAPLSLVNFAGKACAYAFFFAPGIADVLVRLWSLTTDVMRRVADEFGLPRRSKGESNDIVSLFPPNVDGLGWTSVKSMSDNLRQAATLPWAAAKIAWHGPWVSRWRGRDTDLFFIFCKYYYILAEEFMPPGLPLVEKSRAPAFLLVNAQILSILDSTVHRQAAVEAMLGPPATDVLHGADASAMTLPIAPNNNAMKGMNENRLIVLLKDFLSAASFSIANARHTFAEAFMALMKASAKKTSQFDHNACFTLCDFLEESLVAYEGFVDVHRPTLDYVDWPFWFEVCKKILDSNNTMSEIRVLSLIFSIWNAIASDQRRKEAICTEWLLTEVNFDKFFNNWCPMVRAYYMRLLCWRICRDTGSANDSDMSIYMLVSTRLKMVWSHYLWLKDLAEREGKCLPSTAPSYPTPGKRFMIIRTEEPGVQPGLALGFDSFSTQLPLPNTSSPMTGASDSPDSFNSDPSTHKKKWNLIGKVLSFSGNSNNPNDFDTLRRETAAARKTAPPSKQSGGSVTPPTSDTDSMGSSPTYDALQYIFRFTLSWNSPNSLSPPHRILTRPRLPAPAQIWISNRGRSGSTPAPAAGRPAPTRAVSGSANTGLIEAAKNANPGEASPVLDQISTTFEGDSFDSESPTGTGGGNYDTQRFFGVTPTSEPVVVPVKPTGTFATGAKYAGRALAEWGLVVCECNSFVDRRRDEGVPGLSEVEVPILGVEGFRKMG
ncbi:uncharacterized protein BCR38DRAFT_350294 [Pseudomassariella vexata]|uniref:DUF1765-domain-containing protein n=1 Tax=Pseudomassariella vexata TaxID=1141098 RepID=A0A1Y2DM00_9PEZI|nr:uncharacterized protein BCR38DRAFT_350294 [Pseudomassariella vexata]ORY60169.1 hypothetical protein BCR38DRAFT_350294 [Pseudomassariella vexata]